MGAFRRPFDADREVRGLSHRVVSPYAFQGNRYPDARPGPVVGVVPLFIQGVSRLQRDRQHGSLVDKETAYRTESIR